MESQTISLSTTTTTIIDSINGTRLLSFSPRDQINEDDCVVRVQEGTLPLGKDWENIPETLIINGCIGGILFSIFLVITHIAWSRSHNEGDFLDQGLLCSLYGYRDPVRWYVIPRFEFLNHEDRHHSHDMDTRNIYIPPRLPLANPIDLLAMDDDSRDSDDDTVDRPKQRILNLNSNSQSHRSLEDGQNIVKVMHPNIMQQESTTQASKSVGRHTSAASNENNTVVKGLKTEGKIKGKATPLDKTFFYPSILTAEQLQASFISRRLNQFFSKFFHVSDAEIIYAKGIDAYEYLLFQRHLILILFVTNFICLGVLLPLHWFSGSFSSSDHRYTSSFQRTTIKNLRSGSNVYWIHVVSSIAIVMATMYILNSYRQSTIPKQDTQLARRTLLLGNIPAPQRSRQKLQTIIRGYFPRSRVEAIQFVYDTTYLNRYESFLRATIVAKEYCTYYKAKYKSEIWVKPTDVNEAQTCNGNCRLCSFLYTGCCAWPCESKEPGVDYYSNREKYYRDKIKQTIEHLVQEPSEYAFVTFRSYRQAKKVMEKLSQMKANALRYMNVFSDPAEVGHDCEACKNQPVKETAVHKSTKVTFNDKVTKDANNELPVARHTNAFYDPLEPENNPHVRSIRSPRRLEIAEKHQESPKTAGQWLPEPEKYRTTRCRHKHFDKQSGPIAWSARYAPHPDNVEFRDLMYLATTRRITVIGVHLLMIAIFIFITTPNVILSILERWAVFKRGTEHRSSFETLLINYVTILVQVITTAVLPALIILISRQIPHEDAASKNHSVMWKTYIFLVLMVIVMPSIGMNSAQALLSADIKLKCLFPADNGAYYINYVLSSIFLSSVLELIKPSDIVTYGFIMFTGRSRADFEGAREYIEREFSVDMQHTTVLLIFSVVMTYSISCPLIAPVGLIYMIVKHSVDHYHLFYTYFTKKVDKNLQNTVTIFVKVALLFMLFQSLVSIYINTGTSYYSLLSLVAFWMVLAVFLFNCLYDYTSKAMRKSQRNRHHHEFCACFYLPRVFDDLLRSNAMPEECISRQF